MLRRRTLLAVPLMTALATAQDRGEVLTVIETLASGLSSGDPNLFLRGISEEFPERGRLDGLIRALLAAAEVTSSVEVKSLEGPAVQLDWYMEIRQKSRSTVVERRRETVSVQLKEGRILSLAPLSYFRLPSNL